MCFFMSFLLLDPMTCLCSWPEAPASRPSPDLTPPPKICQATEDPITGRGLSTPRSTPHRPASTVPHRQRSTQSASDRPNVVETCRVTASENQLLIIQHRPIAEDGLTHRRLGVAPARGVQSALWLAWSSLELMRTCPTRSSSFRKSCISKPDSASSWLFVHDPRP